MAKEVPMMLPTVISTSQCCERYVLLNAARNAIAKKMNFKILFSVISANEIKIANAEVECPLGKLRIPSISTPSM